MSLVNKNLIVLIHPGFVSGEIPYPPIESIFLASYLEEICYDVLILDQRVDAAWESKLVDVIDNILWVGLTVITGRQILYAIETSRKIKELNKDVPIVFGGWHPTFIPKQTVAHPLVDYVVCGIGELKVKELSEHIKSGQSCQINHYGIVTKESKQTFALEKEKFDWLPKLPAYHLIDLDAYRSKNNVTSMITARGCPFRCSFCTVARVPYINRNIDIIIDEIEFLIVEKSFERINFADGLFFAQKKRVMSILGKLKNKGINFKWKGSVRGDTFRKYNDKEMKKLVNSGLTHVSTGFETGSTKMLKRTKKDVTCKDMIHMAEITGKYGINVSAYFLMGLPGDTILDLRKTIELGNKLVEINPDIKLLSNFYRPLPGSPSYDEMITLGYKPPESLERWAEVADWFVLGDSMLPENVKPFAWLKQDEFHLYLRTLENSIFNKPEKKVSSQTQ